ncbi:MAG: OmpH family outer membrane protein [Lewinellaceae bacterium]|nr:OmpH family outer membrane protein [Lewinellaceae bacterium]
MTKIFPKHAIKWLAVAALAVFSTSAIQAQRIAYVDVNLVLESIQEYQDAQKELDRIAAGWRQEIAQEYDVIKSMYNRYQAEQVLLSDEARKQKEDEIMNKEQSVREMQKEKFGPEGELFKKRQELVQPIQDKVYEAIEAYANDRGYDFIFDKGGAAGILFANPRYDVTSDVLERLKK